MVVLETLWTGFLFPSVLHLFWKQLERRVTEAVQFDALEWSILNYLLNEIIKLELPQPACTCTFLKKNRVSLLKDINLWPVSFTSCMKTKQITFFFLFKAICHYNLYKAKYKKRPCIAQCIYWIISHRRWQLVQWIARKILLFIELYGQRFILQSQVCRWPNSLTIKFFWSQHYGRNFSTIWTGKYMNFFNALEHLQ